MSGDYPRASVLRVMRFVVIAVLAVSSATTTRAQVSEDEQALWKLEHDYWRYVQENDLVAYSTLWHQRFLAGLRSVPFPPQGPHYRLDHRSNRKGPEFPSISSRPRFRSRGTLPLPVTGRRFAG